MLFRQLFDPATSTYTYLLADGHEAVLIDPVKEQVDRDVAVLERLGLRLVATVETHVHADHVTGAWALKQRLGSQIVYPSASGVDGADRLIDEGETLTFGRRALEARRTPGHTDGCTTYVLDDRSKAFTGDALLIQGCGRTDFQQGDARTLYRSVWDQILSLPETTELWPGHDYTGRTVTTVREEVLHNPRLGHGQSEDQFVDTMAALRLNPPRHIARAVPANQALGREADDVAAPARTEPWDAVPRSPTGVRHVTPAWVADHCGEFRVIDVRQPDEWTGPLGHLGRAELVPLSTLGQAAATWDRTAPLVLICRSSGRSDRAARALEDAGFTHVASMVGGMMAWRSQNQVGCA